MTLNENLSNDPRIDVIFINGYSETDATPASKVSLFFYSALRWIAHIHRHGRRLDEGV